MACSVTVTIQSRRRTCSNSWQTMASWMSAGNSAKWPGNTTTGRNSPNVTGPDSADDSRNSACGATAARRRSRRGGGARTPEHPGASGAICRTPRRATAPARRNRRPAPRAEPGAKAGNMPEGGSARPAWLPPWRTRCSSPRRGATVPRPEVTGRLPTTFASTPAGFAARAVGRPTLPRFPPRSGLRPARSRRRGCRANGLRSRPPSDQPPDRLDLVRRQVAVFDQMHQQGLRRTVEHAIDEIPHHGADHPALRLGRAVDVGALHLLPVEVALLFQDLHHRHDGGVGDPAPLQQGLINVPDRGGVPLPDDFHDL